MLSNKKNKGANFINRLTKNYRFTVLKEESFEEKFSKTVSPLLVILLGLTSMILFGMFCWFLFTRTSIKHSIPGYPHQEIINSDIENRQKADSLYAIARSNDLYYENLKAVLRGEKVEDPVMDESTGNIVKEDLDYEISPIDSASREKVFSENQFDLDAVQLKKKTFLEQELLQKPVEGVISDGVHFKDGHFGIDVSAPADTRVKAILEGTVIFSGFTSSGGNEIHIQHNYNLISVYKHNSAVLKNTGEPVRAGESIAIVGNSGEHSDGTHLHFEMWQRGIPLDPATYFSY